MEKRLDGVDKQIDEPSIDEQIDEWLDKPSGEMILLVARGCWQTSAINTTLSLMLR